MEKKKLNDNKKFSNTEQTQPFWVRGVLIYADIDTNIIKLASHTTDTAPQTDYTINVVSETLNTLVKNYWGDIIKVYIKPKNKKGKQNQYELIEIS
jgi:hypothetical protein